MFSVCRAFACVNQLYRHKRVLATLFALLVRCGEEAGTLHGIARTKLAYTKIGRRS